MIYYVYTKGEMIMKLIYGIIETIPTVEICREVISAVLPNSNVFIFKSLDYLESVIGMGAKNIFGSSPAGRSLTEVIFISEDFTEEDFRNVVLAFGNNILAGKLRVEVYGCPEKEYECFRDESKIYAKLKYLEHPISTKPMEALRDFICHGRYREVKLV